MTPDRLEGTRAEVTQVAAATSKEVSFTLIEKGKSWRWKCGCGSNCGSIHYSSSEEALKRVEKHIKSRHN